MAAKSQLRVKFETKAFLKAINNFRTATRRKTGSVLKEVGKLVVRDAMSLSPPNSSKSVRANSKGKVAWKVHKDMGEGAIANDLLGKNERGGIFRVRKSGTFKRAEKLQETLGKDMAGMQNAIWATKDGRVFGVEHNLYQPDASISTMKAHHKKYRGANGRVSRAGRDDLQIGRHVFMDKMFVTKQRFNAYMKHLKRQVGKGKGGWNAAARKLKTPYIPKWIKRHGSSGGSVRVSINHPIHPTIMITNSINYMQKHGYKNQIMRKAIKSQTHNLKKRAKAAIEHAARKSKLKR
jgi:hypothetical protein